MPDPTDTVPAVVVFDLDGTVWDSAPGILSCLVETLAEYSIEPPPIDRLRTYLGPPLITSLAELGIREADLDEARVTYRRHYRRHGEFECTIYDGMPDLLDELRARGHRLATATSKGVEPTQRMLDHFDLRRRFDVVAAASMTATGHSKIDIIGEALAALGSAADSRPTPGFMIGDRNFDIDGGRHHGLTTVGVRWGYAPDGELETAEADHVVGTVAELAALLARK